MDAVYMSFKLFIMTVDMKMESNKFCNFLILNSMQHSVLERHYGLL